MALQQGVAVDQVADGAKGVGLVFWVFPQIINEFPALNSVFGFLFFASVVFAGFTSMISITEAYVSAFMDKFQVSRKKALAVGGGLSAVISIIYATQGGLYFLDVIDHFVNQYGIAFAGLVEVIFVAWYLKQLKPLQQYANEVSDLKIGTWWRVCLGVITPIVLGYMMIKSFVDDVTKPYYGGYPASFILLGVMMAVLPIVLGFFFSKKSWRSAAESTKEAG